TGGVSGWRQPAELPVRAVVIVIVAPGLQHQPRLRQRAEQRFIEQFITKPRVEALGESVLLRLAGLDVLPANAAFIGPFEDRVRGQFRSIVRQYRLRLAAPGDDAAEFARHALAGD